MMNRPELSPWNRDILWDGERPTVWFSEITLRQAGVQNHAELTVAEKIAWLLALDRARVQRAVVWGRDPDNHEVIAGALDAGARIEVEVYGVTYPHHYGSDVSAESSDSSESAYSRHLNTEVRRIIDTARDSGARHVNFTGRSSDTGLEALGWSRDDMSRSYTDVVQMAKEAGLEITLGMPYASQADESYLKELCLEVEEAGADYIEVNDSMGVLSPVGIHRLISEVKRSIRVPISVHCHEDFGLAVANVIAAVEAGAVGAEVVVNGMDPHRSGLASLEVVAVALEMLYGVDTGIELGQLTTVSRLHEQMTGMHPALNRPIVGPLAFNTLWASSELDEDSPFFDPSPFDPAIVGNRRHLQLGRFSRREEVLERLAECGWSVPDDQLPLLVALVHKQARSTKSEVTDDELGYLVGVVSGRAVAGAGTVGAHGSD
jgi:2-isopropylmalate synthase